MNTLLLSPLTWDLLKDSNGNIAMAQAPYAIAQDVASACEVFQGELYFDTTQGVPYLQRIFGKRPSLSFVKSQIEIAALTVPNVVSANCTFAKLSQRTLSGQVSVTDNAGNTIAIGVGSNTNVFILDKSQLDTCQLK